MGDPPRFDPDLEWLDLVRQIGLVIAPSLLKELLLVPELQTRTDSAAVAELLSLDDEEGPALADPWAFAEHILGWPASRLAGVPGRPALSEDLCKVLPEYDTVLEPHWAVAGLDGAWRLLVRIEAAGVGPDTRGALAGWEATPHQRFERLLRETNIPIGVLITDKELRLVYAPRGETSGWIPYVRVFGLAPGVIDTDMQAAIRASGINRISQIRRIDLAPVGHPAAAIHYLCTAAADDLVGQEIALNDPDFRRRIGLA